MQQQELKIKNLSCHESQLRELILPILRGKVFHVTNHSGLKGIAKDGLIRNNKNEDFPYSYPQSARSHARARGRVSLFDLRTTSGDQLETTLSNFYFLNPPSSEDNPIFLILSKSLYPALIPWTRARDEDGWKEMFIPYVEAFHQGNIPVSKISYAVSVRIARAKTRSSTLSRQLDKAVAQLYAKDKRRSGKK